MPRRNYSTMPADYTVCLHEDCPMAATWAKMSANLTNKRPINPEGVQRPQAGVLTPVSNDNTNLSPKGATEHKTNMASSLVKIDIHLIFHIKATGVDFRKDDLPRIYRYIGG